MMFQLFRKLFVYVFLCCGSVNASGLEVCFFDSGQGNLIALKKDNKVLFVDCGETPSKTTGSGIRRKELQVNENPKRGKLVQMLSNIESCHAIITHSHEDHYNLLDPIDEIIQTIDERRIDKVDRYLSWEHDGTRDVLSLIMLTRQILGDDAEVIPIRPDIWESQGGETKQHDINLGS
jgi:glyoxylase-like metal-dependent hydrolase (beta-lactamase superfamily II)